MSEHDSINRIYDKIEAMSKEIGEQFQVIHRDLAVLTEQRTAADSRVSDHEVRLRSLEEFRAGEGRSKAFWGSVVAAISTALGYLTHWWGSK